MTSILATDAYKFSMAQAGFPLRPETFYLSFRGGGFSWIPEDLIAGVRELVQALAPKPDDLAFVRAHGYGLTGAMEAAMADPGALSIAAVPAGTWVYEREPILTVTGPSFLVSWLEPMLLWLNYPIQLASALLAGEPLSAAETTATCADHAALIERIADAVGRPTPTITRDDEAYAARVQAQVEGLVAAVGGDPTRVFEVGMRSAVCMQQHRIALQACKGAGVNHTSNVHLASQMGMTPVGTMGHEHVQRWGADRPAFEAMRDMRASAPSYLLDTFDTMRSGVPAAIEVMRSRAHACSIRYDSGNKFIQYLHACEMCREADVEPAHIIEDGLDLEVTQRFEKLREFTGWNPSLQRYGYGGYIVARPMTTSLTRDRVSAVYKLSQTGDDPRMKFGNEAGLGKQSVPGRPVVWRRIRGAGPLGVIGQDGESVPDDYVLLSGNPEAVDQLRLCNVLDYARTKEFAPEQRQVVHSPATARLIEQIRTRGQAS